MYVYMYVYEYVYVYVYMCVCVCVCICMYVIVIVRLGVLYVIYSYEPEGAQRPRARNCKSTYSTTGRTMIDL